MNEYSPNMNVVDIFGYLIRRETKKTNVGTFLTQDKPESKRNFFAESNNSFQIIEDFFQFDAIHDVMVTDITHFKA